MSLPPLYTLFGHVAKGENVVDAIARAKAHMTPNGDSTPSRPDHPVHIETVTLQVS